MGADLFSMKNSRRTQETACGGLTDDTMPLRVNDVQWSQTGDTVYVSCPLKGVKKKTVDLFSTDSYIKVIPPTGTHTNTHTYIYSYTRAHTSSFFARLGL